MMTTMLQQISNWWNRAAIATAQQQADREKWLAQQQEANSKNDDLLKKYSDALTQAQEEVSVVQTELAETKEALGVYRQRDEADDLRRNGTEPWVEIKSAELNDVKGIQIELDWNDAFIQYLKESGITGKDEDVAVQKWLALLYQDLIERFEAKVVDNSDKPRVNDFE